MPKQIKDNAPLEFEIGDYVTGIDRSYERSIYRATVYTVDKTARKLVAHVGFELIVYEGRWGDGHVQKFPIEYARGYRTATREELIEAGVIKKSIDFITSD